MRFERLLLSLLSILPSGPVAYAAQSRLTTIEGYDASTMNNWNSVLEQKSLIFEPLRIETTEEEAFEHYIRKTGKQEVVEDARVEFNTLIEQMVVQGLINVNESMIGTSIPSRM